VIASAAINKYFKVDHILEQRRDFIITAKRSLDSQSNQREMTIEIARRAKRIALASAIGVSEGAGTCYNVGINALTSILKGPSSLEEAIFGHRKARRR
jgi:glycerate kinase